VLLLAASAVACGTHPPGAEPSPARYDAKAANLCAIADLGPLGDFAQHRESAEPDVGRYEDAPGAGCRFKLNNGRGQVASADLEVNSYSSDSDLESRWTAGREAFAERSTFLGDVAGVGDAAYAAASADQSLGVVSYTVRVRHRNLFLQLDLIIYVVRGSPDLLPSRDEVAATARALALANLAVIPRA